ncbi:ribonuclease H2 subunit B isoform X1 [Coffea eugenioides]|uniref:ribonuclease H2 subunit B isoform X1 n=1 Tax=Coffea eugenioides TaxID=49369 RepID=UPI000F60597E|nr:ribonuclease H2 subunit B isoform X1 [Coffea eugenioides]
MAWWGDADETRVLIAPDHDTNGNGSGNVLSLRHPKTGNKACYLYFDEELLELHWFKQSYGSWFLGDYVCEDGRLYTATPVDPVFILLPIFDEARMKKKDDPGKFRQLDEILYVQGYEGYQQLASIAEKSMQIVCDFKEVGSTKFFRLNDSKVLRWLSYKVHQLRQVLPTLDKNYAAQIERATLVDAVSVIGEYLNEEPWLKLLCGKLNLCLQDELRSPERKILPSSLESGQASFDTNAIQEKTGLEKKTTGKGRLAKKAKVEKNTRNIKDMFSRASRKGS